MSNSYGYLKSITKAIYSLHFHQIKGSNVSTCYLEIIEASQVRNPLILASNLLQVQVLKEVLEFTSLSLAAATLKEKIEPSLSLYTSKSSFCPGPRFFHSDLDLIVAIIVM